MITMTNEQKNDIIRAIEEAEDRIRKTEAMTDPYFTEALEAFEYLEIAETFEELRNKVLVMREETEEEFDK